MTDSYTIYLLIPEIILVVTATLIFVLGAFWRMRQSVDWTALAALVVSAIALYVQDHGLTLYSSSAPASSHGPLAVDLFGHTARWAVLAVGILLILITSRSQNFEQRAEEAASILLMLAGLMLVAAANELILIFVGLELVSIPTYVVLYLGRHDGRGQEAASKYFFLSILSSAVLLYGFSFLYGAAGSTRLERIAQPTSMPELIPLALLLTFAGLAFRLTAVPFHFYAPDVYQGTSNANAGLLSTLPKIAGLAVLARLLLVGLPEWSSFAWKAALVVCVLTMTLGNVLALWQTNVRRLLAYSSIAHAGYLLIGLAVVLAARTTDPGASSDAARTAGLDGLGAAIFYLAVYMFATLGTFAALVSLSRGNRTVDTLDDIAGLNRAHPIVAIAIAVFMFSLAGIPPLAGFWGKFSLLYSALTLPEYSLQQTAWLRPWFVGLAVVTVVNAAIGAAYYLRVIGVMYFRASNRSEQEAARAIGPCLAIAASLVVVVGLGLFPGRFLDAAVQAGESLRPSPVGKVAAADSSAIADHGQRN